MRYAKAAPLEQVFQSSIAELCRREGIAEGLYYAWSKEFLEAGKRRLAGDTARAATSGEVKDLRRQAQELKAVVAGQALALRLGRVLQPTKSLRRSLDHLIGTGKHVGGISRPSAFAVLRLITSSKRVGCCTGRSAGLVPLMILST